MFTVETIFVFNFYIITFIIYLICHILIIYSFFCYIYHLLNLSLILIVYSIFWGGKCNDCLFCGIVAHVWHSKVNT